MGDLHDRPGGVRSGADGVYRRVAERSERRAVGHRLHWQPAAEHGDRRRLPGEQQLERRSRSSIRRRSRWSASSSGSIGNEKRGQCRGPGLFQTDLAFYKTIRAFSKAQIQLRFEIFNLFNNTNFEGAGSGGGGLNNTMSLQSVTLDPAQTQITAYTPSGSFGQATRTRDARQAQFGMKILF